jgi:GcrA cell cycle regulator
VCAQAKSWTDADRDRVAALLIEGRSMGRIGQLMGLSRSAAIGRIYRDAELHRQLERETTRRKAVQLGDKVKKAIRSMVEPLKKPTLQSRPLPPDPPPPPLRNPDVSLKLLFELGPADCRFPVGESRQVIGGFLFCGEAKAEHSPAYCAYHHHRAHGMAKER